MSKELLKYERNQNFRFLCMLIQNFTTVDFLFKPDLSVLPVPYQAQTGIFIHRNIMYSVRVYHVLGLPIGLLRKAIKFS